MSSSSVKQCASYARSTHDVHHAIVGVNVVIGVLLGELHVVRVDPVVVCDDVAIRRTLVLIALCRNIVFIVTIFHRILLHGRFSVYRIRAQRSDEGDPEDPGMNVRACAHWLLTPCDVSHQSTKPPRGWPLATPAFDARSEADTCSASGAHQQRSGLMSLWWSTGVPNHQTFARTPKYLLKNFLTSSDHGNDHFDGIRPGLARSKFDVLDHGHQHESRRQQER